LQKVLSYNNTGQIVFKHDLYVGKSEPADIALSIQCNARMWRCW